MKSLSQILVFTGDSVSQCIDGGWISNFIERGVCVIKQILALCGALSLLAGCASNPLEGQWQYSDGNTTIGLDLQSDDRCELSLSRFVRDDLKRVCRYELNKYGVESGVINAETDRERYLIFLHDDAGNCDVFADFEFAYDKDAGLVHFLVGDTPFAMQKVK